MYRWIPKNAHTSRDLARASAANKDHPEKEREEEKGLGLRAMSLENIAGPGTYSLFHQKEYLLTFPTPTKYAHWLETYFQKKKILKPEQQINRKTKKK